MRRRQMIVIQSRNLDPYGMLDRGELAARRAASDEFRRLAAAGLVPPGTYSSPWGLTPETVACPLTYRHAAEVCRSDYHDVVVID
jgi:hypothetical protein